MRSDQIDSYRRNLQTRVRELREEATAVWVVLEESVFYPTSGGQLHDTGRLEHAGGTARVVDVVAARDRAGPTETAPAETVLHRIEGPAPTVGDEVRADIDWDRRYRHMQRHSAQHLLSQAFLHVGSAFETRSVGLTSPDGTLDLAGEPDDEALEAAFEQARRWAYQNLPIEAFEVDESEVDRYPLRRPPKVSGKIRLVRMGEVELSACGGTHLRSTAEVLPLLSLGRQRIRGGLTRVTFRAGIEAGERAAATVELADRLARTFSARWDELPERVEALREERASAQGEAVAARAAWAEAQLREALRAALQEPMSLSGEGGGTQAAPVVRLSVSDAAQLAPLAEAAKTVAPEAIALLAAADGCADGGAAGGKVWLLFQAGPQAPTETDLRPVLKAALAEVDGRGGGKPDRVQGAGERPERVEAALAAAEDVLRRALTEGRDAGAEGRDG